MAHEVTLHVALVHSFVNPCLLVVLHRGIRQAGIDLLCCSWRSLCFHKARTSIQGQTQPILVPGQAGGKLRSRHSAAQRATTSRNPDLKFEFI